MKNEEEAGFFSLINDTISNDDINFSDFVIILKVLTNEKFIEEDTTNNLKEFFLEGGYELKEIKYQYINNLNELNKPNLQKMEKLKKKLI